MKESILHYVWLYRLFYTNHIHTTENLPVEIIDVGKINTDAGPDFFNAKIRIGHTVWAGNVEIHSFSAEWYKHGHQTDKSYDNVILHVVSVANADVYRTNGEKIPQIEIRFPSYILENYEQLLKEKKWIACSDRIQEVSTVFVESWKSTLLLERLEQKAKAIDSLLENNQQNWEESFYIRLARSFGFGTNNQAFEQLALSIPLSVLAKHKDQLLQLEALLMGQAGFLDKEPTDDYMLTLKNEYLFLQKKYQLQPIELSEWKLFRIRPDNFPQIRIAQFASLIHQSTKLFSKVIANPDLKFLRQLFACKPSDYWKTHYKFEQASPERSKKMSQSSIDILLINTIVPFVFSYGDRKNNEKLKSEAISLLEKIPSEKNLIISKWQQIGVTSQSAFDSQALLQLKKQYCDDKKCLYCRIGHQIVAKKLQN